MNMLVVFYFVALASCIIASAHKQESGKTGIASDPGRIGPLVEIAHLYNDEYVTGILHFTTYHEIA